MKGLRNTEPYDIPGRWYRTFVESDGTNITVTETDFGSESGVQINGGNLQLPGDFVVVDTKYDMNYTSTQSTTYASRRGVYSVTVASDVQKYIVGIPAQAANFDSGYIYVYGYFLGD